MSVGQSISMSVCLSVCPVWSGLSILSGLVWSVCLSVPSVLLVLSCFPEGSKCFFPNGVVRIPHLATEVNLVKGQRMPENTSVFRHVGASALVDPDHPLNTPLLKTPLKNTVCYSLGSVQCLSCVCLSCLVLPAQLSVNLSVSVRLSVCLSVRPSVGPSVCLFAQLNQPEVPAPVKVKCAPMLLMLLATGLAGG